MPGKGKIRSPSIVSQQSYKGYIIADLVAEVQQETNVDDEGPVKTHVSDGVKLKPTDLLKMEDEITPIPDPDHPQESAPKTLSTLRKICFAFSFGPSILFCLLFSVILPCTVVYPACVQKLWSLKWNDTEVTSQLQLEEHLCFTYRGENVGGIRCLNSSSGKQIWENNILSPPTYMECNSKYCVIVDQKGYLHLFSSIDGESIWSLDQGNTTSFPVLMPDCTGDGVDEVAVVVSNTKLRVLYNESVAFEKTFSHCSSFPSLLTSWSTQNKTDLLLICNNGKEDIVLQIPVHSLCPRNGGLSDSVVTLITAKKGLLSNEPKLLTTPESLFIWAEDEVFAFGEEGSSNWKISSKNHSLDNRFLLYGTLDGGSSRIILCSSDNDEKVFKMTLLDTTKSKDYKSDHKSFSNMKVKHAEILHGQNEDILLILSEIFSSNSSFEREEVTLFKLNGEKMDTLGSLTNEGEESKTLLKVSESGKEENETLKIFVLREFQGNSSTQLDCFSLDAWDPMRNYSLCERKALTQKDEE